MQFFSFLGKCDRGTKTIATNFSVFEQTIPKHISSLPSTFVVGTPAKNFKSFVNCSRRIFYFDRSISIVAIDIVCKLGFCFL